MVSEGRSELKFALPLALRTAILEVCRDHITPDLHGVSLAPWLPGLRRTDGGPPVGYRVSSLYLDDPRLDGYAARLDDARIRNRLRIRTYGEPGERAPVFLEAKRKLGPRVIKHRVEVGDTVAWAASDPQHPWDDARGRARPERAARAARWADIVADTGQQVRCRVSYLRETFVQGTSRLTLDHHVVAGATTDPLALRGPCPVPLLPPDWLVLELKYDAQKPAWMRHLIAHLRLASEPVSKFALGVALTLRAHRPAEVQRLVPPSLRRAPRRVG